MRGKGKQMGERGGRSMGRRLVYLDLLRCLAMLLVMVLHTGRGKILRQS